MLRYDFDIITNMELLTLNLIYEKNNPASASSYHYLIPQHQIYVTDFIKAEDVVMIQDRWAEETV